ncbi:MAG: hypothetical protein AAGB19_07490 [Cyanobacteria bacterium P01_F01_bin.3]
MKLVQFLRPLFLVALGLHALVLFLPTGEGEDTVIEDVALEELSEETATSPKPPVPGNLPVPDPNVSTANAAAKPKSAPANAAAARPPVNPRNANNAASGASRRSNSANSSASSQRRAASGANGEDAQSSGDRTRSSSANSSQNNANSQNSASIRNQNADDSSGQSSSQSNSETTIAVVTPQTNSGSDNDDASSEMPSRVSLLITQATRDLPNSLKDLAVRLDRSLTYNPKNTADDPDVQKAKDDWQAELQEQANVGQIELMPPAEIVELTQIEYPIESSLKVEGRSLRRCLTEDPQTAEIGVRFDAQGNIAGEPELLRSTGYSAINEEIKALVAAYDDFPSDRASKAYTFEVEVFYDSELCITAVELQS